MTSQNPDDDGNVDKGEEDLLSPVYIREDQCEKFEKNDHLYPWEYEGHFDSLMIRAGDIRGRVKQLADVLCRDYHDRRRPMLLCTLKGACTFFVHLCDALQNLRFGYSMEFVRASSYDGTSTTGKVHVSWGLKPDSLRGRHVIIVEDILDTGTTLANIVPQLIEEYKPASVETVTLLDKRLPDEQYPKKYQAKYIGFSIPNHFIVGYGLDYNELYRDLKDIFIISRAGIEYGAEEMSKSLSLSSPS